MSDLEVHATLICKAVRETRHDIPTYDDTDLVHETLKHFKRLQDLEYAVLSMVAVQAKGEEQ